MRGARPRGGLALMIIAQFNDGCGVPTFALLLGEPKLEAAPREEDSRSLCVQWENKRRGGECRQAGGQAKAGVNSCVMQSRRVISGLGSVSG
jgi:hypothetical protein